MGLSPAAPGVARGFTLLEILAAMTVVAILVALALGGGRRAFEVAQSARARVELAAIGAALERYRHAQGDYPRTDDPAEMLQALLGRRDPNGRPISSRAVIELGRFSTVGTRDPLSDPRACLADPWGQPYRYAYRTPLAGWRNSRYVLYSAGPDRTASAKLLPGGFPDGLAQANADNIDAAP